MGIYPEGLLKIQSLYMFVLILNRKSYNETVVVWIFTFYEKGQIKTPVQEANCLKSLIVHLCKVCQKIARYTVTLQEFQDTVKD